MPFPPGFPEVAKKENASLNFLRDIGRFVVPGYRETYTKATKILAGSTYTLNMLKETFNLPDDRMVLLYENGVSEDFFYQPRSRKKNDEKINILFVGRLVPYKGADMVIRAIANLKIHWKKRISLIIVGDGEEKNYLQKLVKVLNLENLVQFTGWVTWPKVLQFYKMADIFCFPSVREFGGAVVLEAMACGLPCIVVNNGGIGEYVTEETGFKIEPISRQYVIQQLAEKIEFLLENEGTRLKMSEGAISRAREFAWPNKAQKILQLYHQVINC
ncbi:MAG: glycosyltransferase family 4 protein [Geminocystis sp.]|nr:glycosyltransferase family 4 protein [Geminocystis sp.]MCS7147672.1 glycosyltransferase family 4 protein [Geminocystis sp.]MDW8117226.1 glycosyltransferase family 4 protein [Geminocystis sp.]MDW8463809.1 glycosyltransferase family 4 protein [Geminocystis sp.]